ncbi:MAG: ATP-binding protein, partial [Desulfobacterales bacterium]|nr:ATP-binding protein [Desulfobacterales bacterium]
MDLAEIQKLVEAGESEKVEFKKSTGQLTRAGETLCAFLNAGGGQVLIGVTPEGKMIGQQVSDTTLRDMAAMFDKFEPPASIDVERVPLEGGREIIALRATSTGESLPFTFGGRPYQRVGSTTSVMPQQRYQQLLLERVHSRHRWENEPATGIGINELDQEEILRTVRLGIETGR